MKHIKFFAGVIPPAHISEAIFQIQKQFGDNRLEPHITLRPPVTPLSKDDWLQAISAIATLLSPFEVRLTKTGNFGKGVLFINAESSPLIDLEHRLRSTLPDYELPEKQPSNTNFHPHLTLGRQWCGFTPASFVQMKQMAEAYLQTGYLVFEVNSIRIYHKPNAQGRYLPYKDVRLGQG